MRNVRISVVGLPLLGEDADPVKRVLEALEPVLPDEPDLILLPELCDRSGSSSCYRTRVPGVPEEVRKVARDRRCYIAYPTMTSPDGHWRNSLVMVDRSGGIMGEYHKVYPTAGEMEAWDIRAGKGPVVFDCDFGRVGCAICFDLNFQELAWQYRALSPDLMLFASSYHGGFVQQLWAYNTLAHFAAATPSPRTPSAVLSPVGEAIARSTNYHPYATASVNLDCCALYLGLNAGKLQQARRKYGRRVRVSDPGCLGAVLLSSETEEFTAMDVVREFEMEPVRGYFDRIRELRMQHLED